MAPLHYITVLYGNFGNGCRIFGNRQSRQEASNYIFYVDSGETNTRFCDFKSYCLLNELIQHSHPIYNLVVRSGAAPARSNPGGHTTQGLGSGLYIETHLSHKRH